MKTSQEKELATLSTSIRARGNTTLHPASGSDRGASGRTHLRGGGARTDAFPMTTRAQVAKFLAGPEGATELIVFEFSRAMLMQRKGVDEF